MARYLFFVWFLFSISFASQSEEISLYANSVDSLIDVESDLDFSSLLPNYDYTGTLKISWGIPEKSLENLNKERVNIYVSLEPKSTDSKVRFVYGGNSYTTLHFVLSCVIENKKCASESVLSEEVMVKLRLDSLSSNLNETLVIQADTDPPSSMENILENEDLVNDLREVGNKLNIERDMEEAHENKDLGIVPSELLLLQETFDHIFNDLNDERSFKYLKFDQISNDKKDNDSNASDLPNLSLNVPSIFPSNNTSSGSSNIIPDIPLSFLAVAIAIPSILFLGSLLTKKKRNK